MFKKHHVDMKYWNVSYNEIDVVTSIKQLFFPSQTCYESVS